MLLVEQKLPFARRVARSFCIMDRGRAVAGGAIAELTVTAHRGRRPRPGPIEVGP